MFEINPNSIEVIGNKLVSENKILNILKIGHGKNILKINLNEYEKEIERNPRIKKVEIRRNYPDSLIVNIEEVVPAGYLIKNGIRYVVTKQGDIFPGPEGPAIKFKKNDSKKIKRLSALLDRIEKQERNYFNKIIAVDMNYKNDVIIHTHNHYSKWPNIERISDSLIKKYVLLMEKIEEKCKQKNDHIVYMDLRYIEFNEERIDGTIIVKTK